MTRPWIWARRGAVLAILAAAWVLLVCHGQAAPLLNLHELPPVDQAGVFFAIWTGIQVIGAALAAAAEVTAAYLAIAFSWLAGVVGSFLLSTGAMFARIWDGLKIVWSDVLRPALIWADTKLKAAYDWMKQTFKPVFDFLADVRRRINDFYNTFVKPVVDTIEFIRQINRALLAFHITVLQDLDGWLQELEQRINEPFLWVNEKLNKIWGVLDLIVTANGFFQQLTLIRSMARYAPHWMRVAVNARSKPLTAGDYDRIYRAFGGYELKEVHSAVRASLLGQPGRYDAFVDEFSKQWRIELETP